MQNDASLAGLLAVDHVLTNLALLRYRPTRMPALRPALRRLRYAVMIIAAKSFTCSCSVVGQIGLIGAVSFTALSTTEGGCVSIGLPKEAVLLGSVSNKSQRDGLIISGKLLGASMWSATREASRIK